MLLPMSKNTVLTLGLLTASASAVKYGHNTQKVVRDSPAVERNFPPVDITLYGPAFESNTTLLPGFSNGTQSPIDDGTLGISSWPLLYIIRTSN